MEEQPDLFPEELKKIKKRDAERKRVDNLGEQSDPAKGEDLVWDLANFEDKLRDEMTKDGLSQDLTDKYSNKQTSQLMGRLEAEKMSETDSLTGLRNRKSMITDAPKILARERREGNPCSLLMIDIDDFGPINKEHGYLSGNEVLKKITQIIKESTRNSDYIFRAGGEEIVVVLPNQDISIAQSVAERIRKSIENCITEVKTETGDIKLKKTVSIGVVGSEQIDTWSKDLKKQIESDILIEMLQKSDFAERIAKRSGKNKVILYDKFLKDIDK